MLVDTWSVHKSPGVNQKAAHQRDWCGFTGSTYGICKPHVMKGFAGFSVLKTHIMITDKPLRLGGCPLDPSATVPLWFDTATV